MRNIGYRIFDLTVTQNKEATLMRKLNFSAFDMQRLYAGRLAVSYDELNLIANTLNVSVDDILNYKETNGYPKLLRANITQSSADKILDIIDAYTDIKECIL